MDEIASLTYRVLFSKLPHKMSELERAGERVEKQRQVFESLKPQLVQLEQQALERISPRITDILQEAKAFIEEREDLSIEYRTQFVFRVVYTGEELEHSIVKKSDNQEQHYWRKLFRVYGKERPVYGGGSVTDFYRIPLDSPLRKTPGEDTSDISGWVDKNITLKEIRFCLTNQDEKIDGKEPEEPLIEIGFSIKSLDENRETIYTHYDERIGMGSRKKLGVVSLDALSGFEISSGDGVDGFAESLYHFLQERRYIVEGFKKTVSTDEAPPAIIEGEVPAAIEDTTPEDDDIRKRMEQIIEDQRRDMQAVEESERERVLLEIRHRLTRDPGYKPPAGIPEEDIISIRDDHDRFQTEDDRFSTEEDFQEAFHRQYPQGPDH